MALVVPPPNEKKRVKVYELRNNDWFDRGTGFCTGRIVNDESKVYVESEDQPERLLLETKITKDDGYQKQQDTLIVWTEQSGADMALSFQEAEGCAAIWEFVSQVQQVLIASAGPDDALSDDAMETFSTPLVLPQPELRNLDDIQHIMRGIVSTPQGRDALSKFIISEDYVRKLIPLVEMAEDLESLDDLHHLCNIMKTLILLNDTQIIEQVVNDNMVLGVVGALEYDPDFPDHKANHRRYLQDPSRYKEVVPIADPAIKKKIHSTWRLQYLKDVVLARILDDPTFSVLNSLIFYNQVDIVSYLQSNTSFLRDLFGIIDSPEPPPKRKKDAVEFIQQCCGIAKNLQPPARATLYSNFIHNGLLRVITYALSNKDASTRVAGTDILVAMIDHDPSMVRAYIFRSIADKQTPLTDVLIELLLAEVDLGVKAQAADAIKVLLEPQAPPPPPQEVRQNGEYLSKLRGTAQPNNQNEAFVHKFYDMSANKLFQPLRDLEKKESLNNLSFDEVSLYSHLVEILMFLVRLHLFRSRFFIFTDGLASRIAQLLSCPQKHLKLTALKFFRQCINLQDEWYNGQICRAHLFGPILNIVYETMPRDNLLNSACLEMFELIKRENIKPLIVHIVETYRDKLMEITYVDTFQNLVLRYDQMMHHDPEQDAAMAEAQDVERGVTVNGNQRYQGLREQDAAEEAYFNTSDDEDELPPAQSVPEPSLTNGASPLLKSLVDYPDEDGFEDTMDAVPIPIASSDSKPKPEISSDSASSKAVLPVSQSPPERLSEKRRRQEDDDEDALVKLSNPKRRSSTSSMSSIGSQGSNNVLRRKKSFLDRDKDGANGGKKIAISFGGKKERSTSPGSKGDDGG